MIAGADGVALMPRASAIMPGIKTGEVVSDGPFHALLAWLLVVVAVVGFAPRSLAIVTGTMPNPPFVVHPHAAVMAAWVSLLGVAGDAVP